MFISIIFRYFNQLMRCEMWCLITRNVLILNYLILINISCWSSPPFIPTKAFCNLRLILIVRGRGEESLAPHWFSLKISLSACCPPPSPWYSDRESPVPPTQGVALWHNHSHQTSPLLVLPCTALHYTGPGDQDITTEPLGNMSLL